MLADETSAAAAADLDSTLQLPEPSYLMSHTSQTHRSLTGRHYLRMRQAFGWQKVAGDWEVQIGILAHQPCVCLCRPWSPGLQLPGLGALPELG